MAYRVLARKYRPQRFEDVYAQEHITRTLSNAINLNRIAHAYLFTGPRGVGKTSMARIFSKSLNCVHGPTPEPCNVCDNCVEITAGTSSDVIEIDGASNTSVEDVRDLQRELMYATSKSKYKIYIIDEVHMLSKSAFNALLKTLEEPPGERYLRLRDHRTAQDFTHHHFPLPALRFPPHTGGGYRQTDAVDRRIGGDHHRRGRAIHGRSQGRTDRCVTHSR